MKSTTFQRFVAVALTVSALAAGPLQAAEREAIIPGRPEVTTRTLIVTPDGTPRAAAVLFVGGNGDLSAMKGNFLMRIRQSLAQAGILLAFPDAPSDRSGRNNLNGNFRASEQHARDAQGVVQFLKKQAQGNSDLPVFLIGTSRGSTSAANAATRLGPNLIAGVALTSSVTQDGERGQISIYQTAVKDIRVPALVMWHEDDACRETPPAKAGALAETLKASPKVTVKTLTGGSPPRSAPCDASSAHGFLGLEAQASAAILAWIDETIAAK
jgi:pimeloyl-ACP methyl ester carboxylesterase